MAQDQAENVWVAEGLDPALWGLRQEKAPKEDEYRRAIYLRATRAVAALVEDRGPREAEATLQRIVTAAGVPLTADLADLPMVIADVAVGTHRQGPSGSTPRRGPTRRPRSSDDSGDAPRDGGLDGVEDGPWSPQKDGYLTRKESKQI
jgi:hypothetical protein